MREPVPGLRLGHAVADFLTDLAHANRSAATIRAYRTDLASFPAYHRGPPESITPDVLRGYFATLAHLAPATPGPPRGHAGVVAALGISPGADRGQPDGQARPRPTTRPSTPRAPGRAGRGHPGRHPPSPTAGPGAGATIEHVFYPVFPPGSHADEVLGWLRANPVTPA